MELLTLEILPLYILEEIKLTEAMSSWFGSTSYFNLRANIKAMEMLTEKATMAMTKPSMTKFGRSQTGGGLGSGKLQQMEVNTGK